MIEAYTTLILCRGSKSMLACKEGSGGVSEFGEPVASLCVK